MVQSWGQLDAAKAQIEATTAQVNAAEIALNGVREEARVGQRTTLDVLNRSRNWSMPRRPRQLGLNVLIYDPQVHYQQVRDAWVGVRNPDGR